MGDGEYFYMGPITDPGLKATCGKLLAANRDMEIETGVSPSGDEWTAYKVRDRAHFVDLMREAMLEAGVVRSEDEFFGVDQEDISDFRSSAALCEIFNVNKRSWVGKKAYQQGIESPVILDSWPALRFERRWSIDWIPERFRGLEGFAVLKTNEAFWASLGDDPLLDLRRPWDPDGFSKYFRLVDVTREEAQELGLDVDDIDPKTGQKLNAPLSASVKTMDPDLKAALLKELQGKLDQERKDRARITEEDNRIRLEEINKRLGED
jgi:hypothetical protein